MDTNLSVTRILQTTQWASALGLDVETLLPQIPRIPLTLSGARGGLDLLTLVPFHLRNAVLTKAVKLPYYFLKPATFADRVHDVLFLTDAAFGQYDRSGGHTDDTLVLVDDTRYSLFTQYTWRWVLAHDGSLNLNRTPSDCLAECMTGPFHAGVDKVGVAIHYIHGAREHGMDLPASVHARDRDRCAAVVTERGSSRLIPGREIALPYERAGTVVFVFE